MALAQKTCVIGRENNVVRVDFTRKPEPLPAPRFPGAGALRQFNEQPEMHCCCAPRSATAI